MSSWLRGAGACLVFVAFAVALVAFGGRSLAWVVVSTALAAAIAAILLLLAGSSMTPRRSVAVPALALILLGGAGILSLPPRVVEALSPKRHAIARAVHDASPLDRWLAAARGSAVSVTELLGGAEVPSPAQPEAAPSQEMPRLAIAFDAPAARVALAVLACWLALLLALSAQSERLGLRILAAACVLTTPMALYAMIWARIGNGRIYGIFPAPPNVLQQPFGPFWNANHFAALLAMTGLVASAAALSSSLSKRLRVVAGIAALPLLAGVVDAGSRGGLMGLGAGIGLLGLMLLASRRRALGLSVTGLAAAGLLVAFVVLPERLIGESLGDTVTVGEVGSNFERKIIYVAEGEMARSAPLAGIGLGSFRTAYPAFQEEATVLAPLHGESDWLETLAEGGTPLLLAWVLLAGALVAPTLRVMRRGRAPILLLGLVASLGGVLIHASVDFHLREPSVALVALLVAATAHGWARHLLEEESPSSDGASTDPRWTRVATATLAILGAIGCVVLMRVVPWDAAMRSAEHAFARGEIASARDAALRATKADSARGASWALLAASEEQLARVVESEARARQREAALDAAVEALRRDPAALGAARIAAQSLLAGGALEEALQAARLAVLVAPGQAAAHRVLGETLLLAGKPDEALPQLAFALDAMPGAQLATQAPLLTRLLRDAGARDVARIFGALETRRARISYVHQLQRSRHEDEIGPYLRYVLNEGVPAAEADDWTYGLVGNSPEAVELANALLKDARSPVALTRIGKTLAQAGDPRGRELLDQIVARDDAPALVFEVLVTILRGEGRREEARAMALRAAERHPEQPSFAAIARSLEEK